MFAVDIAPEADAGSACVSECEIHPAIFVEVEGDHADSRRQIFFFEIYRGEWREFSFAGIEENRRAVTAARENEIDGAVVVEIRCDEARAGGVEVEGAFGGHVGERAVAVVAPKNVVSFTRDVAEARGLHVMYKSRSPS